MCISKIFFNTSCQLIIIKIIEYKWYFMEIYMLYIITYYLLKLNCFNVDLIVFVIINITIISIIDFILYSMK